MVNYATTTGLFREFGNINVISIKDGIAKVCQDLVTTNKSEVSTEKRHATVPVLAGEHRESLWDRLNLSSDQVINGKGQVVTVKMAV